MAVDRVPDGKQEIDGKRCLENGSLKPPPGITFLDPARIFRILDAILRSANKRRFHAEYRLEYRSRIGEGKGNAHAKNKGDVFQVLLPGPGIEMPLRNDIEKNYRDRRQGQNRHV